MAKPKKRSKPKKPVANNKQSKAGKKMGKKKANISGTIVKSMVGILAMGLILLAGITVYINSGKQSLYNVIAVQPHKSDHYYINEPIHTFRGSVIITNVEEFGPGKTQVAAIIHYYNTTPDIQKLRIREIGDFTDGQYIYTMTTQDDKEHTFNPGESGIFKVTFEHEEGVDGILFYISETMINMGDRGDSNVDEKYRAVVTLDTQRKPELIEEEMLLYGMEKGEAIDLTLPENEKYILDTSVKMEGDDLEQAQEGQVDQAEVDRVLAELEAKENGNEVVDGRLTQREIDLMNTRMTEAEIKEAISKITLPGIDEWGVTAPKLSGGRNIDGLPLLDQANAFDLARNGDNYDGTTVDAEVFARSADEIQELTEQGTQKQESQDSEE